MSKQSFTNYLTKSQKVYLLAGINRPVIPGQVTKLAQSIDKMGIIRPIVLADIDFIDGKKKSYIIDGQHLFHACMRNNLDAPYVKIEIKDKQDMIEKIALLNASSKSWTMVDYITAWGCVNSDYQKLFKYYNTYDFDLPFLSGVLRGTSVADGGGNSPAIKKGTFKITDEKENIQILDYVTDMLKIIPRLNRNENRYVCAEYVKFLRVTLDYNHNHFLAKLEKNKEKFVLATHEPEKLSGMFKTLNK